MRLIPRIAKLLAIMMAGIPALKAAANGFAIPDQDAFATARGEAVTATADNPSAIFYNPAGITQLEGHNLRVGIYAIDFDSSFKPPEGAPNQGHTYRNSENIAAIPRSFYTYTPADFPLSFGLGIYAPFGGKTSWPQDTGFRSVALEGSLTYLTINPVAAYQVTPTLSFGAGLMLNSVDLSMEQGLRAFEKPLVNYFRFGGDGWSVGYNLGARYQPLEQLAFGVSLRSKAKVMLDGQTEFEQQPFISSSHRSAQAEFTFPLSVISGVSYRPTPKWNLEFDASYTDWSSFGTTTIQQASPPFPLRAEIPVALNWQSSWIYELGATRYFDNGWNVSAGYAFSENSVPDENYTPLAADLDRHFFSVGTGFKGKHFSFDAAYQLGYGPTHTVTGSTPSSTPGQIAGQTADGKYAFSSSAVSLSVGWRF